MKSLTWKSRVDHWENCCHLDLFHRADRQGPALDPDRLALVQAGLAAWWLDRRRARYESSGQVAVRQAPTLNEQVAYAFQVSSSTLRFPLQIAAVTLWARW
jgi:hypothetical protein